MALQSDLTQIGFSSRQANFLGDSVAIIAAAGTTQGTATAIQNSLTQVLTATGGVNDGVVLPLISLLKHSFHMVGNTSGATVKIYPGSGNYIMALAANAPMSLPNNCSVLLFRVSSTNWQGVLGAAIV